MNIIPNSSMCLKLVLNGNPILVFLINWIVFVVWASNRMPYAASIISALMLVCDFNLALPALLTWLHSFYQCLTKKITTTQRVRTSLPQWVILAFIATFAGYWAQMFISSREDNLADEIRQERVNLCYIMAVVGILQSIHFCFSLWDHGLTILSDIQVVLCKITIDGKTRKNCLIEILRHLISLISITIIIIICVRFNAKEYGAACGYIGMICIMSVTTIDIIYMLPWLNIYYSMWRKSCSLERCIQLYEPIAKYGTILAQGDDVMKQKYNNELSNTLEEMSRIQIKMISYFNLHFTLVLTAFQLGAQMCQLSYILKIPDLFWNNFWTTLSPFVMGITQLIVAKNMSYEERMKLLFNIDVKVPEKIELHDVVVVVIDGTNDVEV